MYLHYYELCSAPLYLSFVLHDVTVFMLSRARSADCQLSADCSYLTKTTSADWGLFFVRG